jgi:hypothetical protein
MLSTCKRSWICQIFKDEHDETTIANKMKISDCFIDNSEPEASKRQKDCATGSDSSFLKIAFVVFDLNHNTNNLPKKSKSNTKDLASIKSDKSKQVDDKYTQHTNSQSSTPKRKLSKSENCKFGKIKDNQEFISIDMTPSGSITPPEFKNELMLKLPDFKNMDFSMFKPYLGYEILGKGRCGCVITGVINNKEVAIKVSREFF